MFEYIVPDKGDELRQALTYFYLKLVAKGYLKFFNHPNLKFDKDGKLIMSSTKDVIVSQVPFGGIRHKTLFLEWMDRNYVDEDDLTKTLDDVIDELCVKYNKIYAKDILGSFTSEADLEPKVQEYILKSETFEADLEPNVQEYILKSETFEADLEPNVQEYNPDNYAFFTCSTLAWVCNNISHISSHGREAHAKSGVWRN
jgi:hypothetical protein